MNNKMPKTVDNFLNYLENEEKSPKTIMLYKCFLEMFFKFYKQNKGLSKENFDNIDISDITIENIKQIDFQDLLAFMSFLKNERKNNANSRANKVAILKSFFYYLTNIAQEILVNPSIKLNAPKRPERLPKYLTLEESEHLLGSIKKIEYSEKDYSIRDYAIIITFLTAGIRLSELVTIDIDSIKDGKVNIIGKGNKERPIKLSPSSLHAINEYMQIRPNVNSKALFISERNDRLSTRAVQYLVKKHIEKAGLDSSKITTHKLRHTAATLMYQNGADIRSIQEVLGHSNVATTEIYTHVSDVEIEKTVNMNPLANII